MLRIEILYGYEAQRIVSYGAANYTPEHSALDLFLGHGSYCYYCKYGHKQGHYLRPGGVAKHKVEGMKVNKRGVAVHNNAAVLQAEEGDEQADTRRYGSLYGLWYGVEYNAAQAGNGKYKEHYAVHKNHDERVCIGEVHADAYRKHKKCIKAHAGSLRKRQIGKQAYQKRAEHGGYGRCNIYGVIISVAKCGEHARIDHEYVRHRHERGNAGDKLRAHGCIVLFQVKHYSSCVGRVLFCRPRLCIIPNRVSIINTYIHMS